MKSRRRNITTCLCLLFSFLKALWFSSEDISSLENKRPVLAETPVTQRSPCYSAVSASLMNPLLVCSKYSPFCHTHNLILRINTFHCCSALQSSRRSLSLQLEVAKLDPKFARLQNKIIVHTHTYTDTSRLHYLLACAHRYFLKLELSRALDTHANG